MIPQITIEEDQNIKTKVMENIKWEIDPSHSEVFFKIKHLEIATLTGRFDEITGTAEAEDDFENALFSFTANVNSIDTNDKKRDDHLKSADFFDAEKFPKITFNSTKFKRIGDKTFEILGKFTIKGITKPTILHIDYGGSNVDHWGNTKAGLKIKGVINRRDYGLIWNAAIESGGVLVSEEVRINANIQLIKNQH
ncbi:YceI family protein [Flavobacterium aquiphilum]|uniref:YceI family protein n=1 Tax=Flavobacterium aquiphilum TaxID=3003261 RepID=UPI002480FA28|nr:YceI family protein [Flavobacterium aquiphilum]